MHIYMEIYEYIVYIIEEERKIDDRCCLICLYLLYYCILFDIYIRLLLFPIIFLSLPLLSLLLEL